MANFEKALAKTLAYEGGYVNNPNDKGGETFCGISRKYWPDWEGWEVIDSLFESGATPKEAGHETLKMVQDFYRLNFWLPIHGDEIESQEIAEYLFDFAVNSGICDAAKALQHSINRVTPLHTNPDGMVGPDTLECLESAENLDTILADMRANRLAHILENIGKGNIHPSFARGLARRAMA